MYETALLDAFQLTSACFEYPINNHFKWTKYYYLIEAIEGLHERTDYVPQL